VAPAIADVTSKEGEAALDRLTEKFGDQSELIRFMLLEGRDFGGEAAIVLQNLVKNSNALAGTMLESFRVSSLQGEGLMFASGMALGDALQMSAETRMLVSQMKDVIAAQDKVAETKTLQKLFKLEKPEQVTPAQRAFAAGIRTPEGKTALSDEALLTALRDLGGKQALAAYDEKPINWKDYLNRIQGVPWFAGVLGSLGFIKDLLTQLPTSLGLVIGGLIAGRAVLKGLLPKVGAGVAAGRFGTGMGSFAGGATRNIARQGLARRALAGAGRQMMVRGLGAGVLGTGVAAAAIYSFTQQARGWVEGWKNAGEILSKVDDKPISILERFSASVGQAMENLTLGALSAGDVAKGQTGIQKWVYDKLFKGFEDPVTVPHGEATSEGGAASPPSTVSPKRAAMAGVPAGGSAKATASISQGKLVLEVSNWEDVLAESQLNLAAHVG